MGWGTRNGDHEGAHADLEITLTINYADLGTLTQRCRTLARCDVDADWLRRLAAMTESLPLLDSDTSAGLGDTLLTAAAAPRITPEGLAPDPQTATSPAARHAAAEGLAELVMQLDRVMAWAGAHQAAALAALGRPGVAVPIGDLLDAVTNGGSGGPLGADSADALRSSDHEAAAWQDVSVAGDDAWDDAAADQAQRIASAEVGTRLAWTPATARSHMLQATDVVDALPLAHRLWAQGRLDRTRVMAIADRTQDLDPAARALVEEHLLADDGQVLRSKTTPRVKVLVDRCAAALDPDAVRRRQERALQARDVYVTPREDGMSRFSADVPTPVAVLARSVIDHVAQQLSPERSIGQRRADVFADLFTQLAAHGHVDLRGTSEPPATDDQPETSSQTEPPETDADKELSTLLPTDWEQIDTGITVIIDAATLDHVDLTDVPAIEGALLGSHPALPADLVHTLARSAKRARIALRGTQTRSSDPATNCRHGCASTATNLTLGADTYRPSPKLTEQVILRDRVCRFPGCRHPARACDLDHRRPFTDGGPTTAENLDTLCRTHHRLKTFTGWRAIREPGNILTWTSPLGATITDEPEAPPPF